MARQVLTRIEAAGDGLPRPRRAATARLDLALALTGTDQPDEAAATALDAVTSGLLVPSSYWRAREVIAAVGDAPGSGDLRDAYRELCRASPRGHGTGTPDHRRHHLDRAEERHRWPSAQQLTGQAVGSAVTDVAPRVASTPNVSMQRASHGVDRPLRAAHSIDSEAAATMPSTRPAAAMRQAASARASPPGARCG